MIPSPFVQWRHYNDTIAIQWLQSFYQAGLASDEDDSDFTLVDVWRGSER